MIFFKKKKMTNSQKSTIIGKNVKIYIKEIDLTTNTVCMKGYYPTPGVPHIDMISKIIYDYNNYLSGAKICKKYNLTSGQLRHFYDKNKIKENKPKYVKEESKIISMYNNKEKNYF